MRWAKSGTSFQSFIHALDLGRRTLMAKYILASAVEHQRLRLQAQLWEPEAERLFDEIGLHPGWHCLDLGCGAMGVLGPLSRRAEAQGQVIGVDTDPSALSAAQAYLQELKLANVQLLARDVVQTGLPDASFDLVHARFVLPYIRPPEALLKEMVRLARPGGWVVSQEPDNTAWTFYPPDPEWERFKALLIAAFALRGDIDIGKRTYELFGKAGLEDLRLRAAVLALPPQHPYMRMPLMAMTALQPHILQQGLATAEELESMLAHVEQRTLEPATVQLTFVTVQVWGRKPVTAARSFNTAG
jgi:SAM-dependent methyltransferase